MSDARRYWILDRLAPRAVGAAEWDAWWASDGRFAMSVDITGLRRDGWSPASVETNFVSQPHQVGGRTLFFRTSAWVAGRMIGSPHMAASLGRAKSLHWLVVDRLVACGWEVAPLVIEEARAWGEKG